MSSEEAVLGNHEHGKGRVRLVKVKRTPQRHYVQQLNVEILLKAPVAANSYYTGDNSSVLPTDSCKNTVYALANEHDFDSIEEFGEILTKHFVTKHPQMIDEATAKIVELQWTRLETPDSNGVMRPHHHAFVVGETESRFTVVTSTRASVQVSSGFSDLRVLKTTQSSFVNFFKDEYTTLPDVDDRLVGTIVKASWRYKSGISDYNGLAACIRKTLLETFAGPSDVGSPSPAVQYTLYKMGEAVLQKCPSVVDITIRMPNVHNLPVDLSRFGLKKKHPHGEIFQPVDEPHGIIEATVTRKGVSRL